MFENAQQHYQQLAVIVPQGQYYRYHDQWKSVTQRLCFLASLIIYLEVKILVTKETVADILGSKFFSKLDFIQVCLLQIYLTDMILYSFS